MHWVELDKRRPAVVISPDRRNASANDVIVIPVSTSARRMRWHVQLRRGEGGVSQDSSVRCESVITVHQQFVEPEALGILSEARMREIEVALLSALGIDD